MSFASIEFYSMRKTLFFNIWWDQFTVFADANTFKAGTQAKCDNSVMNSVFGVNIRNLNSNISICARMNRTLGMEWDRLTITKTVSNGTCTFYRGSQCNCFDVLSKQNTMTV